MPPMPSPVPEERATRYQVAERWADEWSHKWFLDRDGADRIKVSGSDAGWASHIEAYDLLFRLALARLNVGAYPSRSPLDFLKTRGLDRAPRSLGLRVLRRTTTVGPTRLAVVVEIPTPSMVEPAALVAQAAGAEASIGVADPRAAHQLQRWGVSARPLVIDWRAQRDLLRQARSEVMRQWGAIRRDPPDMRLGDADVTADAMKVLQPLAERSLPWIAVERAALVGFLADTRSICVAVGSDQHRIGRITCEVAHEAGVPVVVLQHGLPQDRTGFLPVVADAVATWSSASRDWFLAEGTPAEAIHVTGNPRLDSFAQRRPQRPGAEARPRVLLALSPTTQATNLPLVLDTLAALDRLPGASLVIKLHPGQSDWGFVPPAVPWSLSRRVRIVRHEPLYPLLSSTDVTVVHRSSVAVESLAAGAPVVVHQAGDEPTGADIELAPAGLPVTQTPAELAVAIGELSSGSGREAFFKERQAGIENLVGPIDGRAAMRVLELMQRGPELLRSPRMPRP